MPKNEDGRTDRQRAFQLYIIEEDIYIYVYMYAEGEQVIKFGHDGLIIKLATIKYLAIQILTISIINQLWWLQW